MKKKFFIYGIIIFFFWLWKDYKKIDFSYINQNKVTYDYNNLNSNFLRKIHKLYNSKVENFLVKNFEKHKKYWEKEKTDIVMAANMEEGKMDQAKEEQKEEERQSQIAAEKERKRNGTKRQGHLMGRSSMGYLNLQQLQGIFAKRGGPTHIKNDRHAENNCYILDIGICKSSTQRTCFEKNESNKRLWNR